MKNQFPRSKAGDLQGPIADDLSEPRAKARKRKPSYRMLEQRIAFDAAAVATVVSAADQQADQDTATESTDTAVSDLQRLAAAMARAPSDVIPEASASADATLAAPARVTQEIVFIDSGVQDKATLLAGINPNAEVIILDAARDGVEQIAEVLSTRSGIDAIHILSHGSTGQLQLGNTILDARSMQGEHADELGIIKAALSDDADILLYGCNVASGPQGDAFLGTLAERTGADIAASDDLTGHRELGGDWDLEKHLGDIGASVAFSESAQQLWTNVLETLDWDTAAWTQGSLTGNFVVGSGNVNIAITGDTDDFLDSTPSETVTATTAADGGTGQSALQLYVDFEAQTTLGDEQVAITINFTHPGGVSNVSFSIFDIDFATFTDQVIVTGDNGSVINPTTVTGSTANAVSGNMVTGTSAATNTTNGGTATFTFNQSGITQITILYRSGQISDPTVQLIALHDITFSANDAPVLDLDASGAGTGFSSTYVEGGAAVQIIDVDSSVTDADDTNMESAMIVISNVQAGDVLSISGALPAGIVSSYDSMTGTLSLTGSATRANYETALEQVRFSSTSENPTTTARTINVVVNDGLINSNTAVATVNITPVLDPVVDLNSTPTVVVSGPSTVTSNLVSNGSFADNSAAPASWTETGTNGTGANGRYIWTSGTNGLSQAITVPANTSTLTETVVAGVLTSTKVDTTNAINSISFDMAWQDSANNTNTLVVSYAGVTLATFTSGVGTGGNNAGVVGTWSYALGVSGPATTNSVTNESTGTLSAITLTFATALTGSGTLQFSYAGGGSDDIAIDNVQVTNTASTITTTTTADTAANNWTVTYTENGAAVAIADTDSSIFDSDSSNIASGTVVLTNKQTSDQLLIGTTVLSNGSTGTVSGITYTVTETAGTISIALTGSATKAIYADFIETIKFQNSSENPNTTARTINVTVSDGTNSSNTAVATITVTSVNDAPALDLDGSAAGTGYAVTYTENGTAVAIADTDLAIGDVDNTTLTGAAITLTNAQAGDVLAAGTMPVGITASVAGNVVTLSGTASIADYQTAIRAITFASTSENPATVTRSITVTVNDGTVNSSAAAASISINLAPDPANDTAATNEDTSVSGNVLTNDTDLGTTPITSVAVTAGPANGTVTAFNTTTGAYTYQPNPNFFGADSFTYTITDANGDTKTATVTITVNAVNDAPVVVAPLSDLTRNDAEALSIAAAAAFADVDGPGASYTVVGLPVGLSINAATGLISGTIDNAASVTGPYTIDVTRSDGAGGSVTETFILTVLNPVPVAVNDTNAGGDSSTLSGNVLTGTISSGTGTGGADSDPDGDSISVTLIQSGASSAAAGAPLTLTYGAIAIAANGSYTFTPNAAANALANGVSVTETITYTISDGEGGTATATLTLTITGGNDAPTSSAIANQTNADANLISLNVSGNFSDPDSGDTLTYTATGLPTGLVINATTGVISGTIDNSASTIDPFSVTVTATDSGGLQTAQSFTWVVTNPAPVAQNDALAASENQSLSGSVFANNGNGADSDPDGDTLAVSAVNGSGANVGSAVAGSNGGTFTIAANGSYTFNPGTAFDDLATGVTRVTTISYTLSDGEGGTSVATIAVTVTGTNDAPVHTVPGAQTVSEDTNFIVAGVSVTDIDGGPVTTTLSLPANTGTLTVVTGGGATITGNGSGSVTIAGTAAQINAAVASITYTPVGDYNTGTPAAPIGLTVSTSDGSAPAVNSTIAITVTPVGDIAGNSYTFNEDDAPQTLAVLGNDTFENGAPLVTAVNGSAITVGGPAVSVTGGSITLNGSGQLIFTPTANYNGAPSFTYTVLSGGVAETATVNLTIVPQNDAPVANDDNFTVTEDGSVTIAVRTNDSDIDAGTTLSITHVDGNPIAIGNPVAVTNGTVSLTALGQLVFTPVADYNGPASFTYTISDGTLSDTATVTGTVSPGNDAPFAANDSNGGVEDLTLTGNVITGAINSGMGVGGIDSDPEGSALAVSSFQSGVIVSPAGATMPLTYGSLTIASDGSYTFVPNAAANALPVGAIRTHVITYTLSDGGLTDTATLTLTITGTNDGAVISGAISGSVTEDVDGDSDGLLEAFGNLTAADPDTGESIFQAGSQTGTYGTFTLAANGGWTYAAANASAIIQALGVGDSLSETFTVLTADGTSQVVTITINGANDAPDAVNDTYTLAEDGFVSSDLTPGSLGQDSDRDGDTITIVDGDGNALNGLSPVVAPLHGTLVLNADGTFTYTPTTNYNGADSFTYRVSDGNGGFDTAVVTLTVTPVNDAPDAVNDTISGPDSTAVSGDLIAGIITSGTGVGGADTDLDGNVLQVTLVQSGASMVAAGAPLALTYGSITVAANGTYTFTPNALANGLALGVSITETVTYTVSDGNGGSTTAQLTITVTGGNDAPVAVNGSTATNEDAPVTSTLPAATDPDGDPLTYGVGSSLPQHGTVVVNPDGTFTYTPAANFNGTDTFTYTVTDGTETVTRTMTVTVNPVNDAPTGVDAAITTDKNTPAFGKLPAGSDPDGDTLKYGVGSTRPAHGTVVVLANGKYIYTPAQGYAGSDTFTYTITDGTVTIEKTVTVDVRPVNAKPDAKDDHVVMKPGESINVNVLGNDRDGDGDALRVAAVAATNGHVSVNSDGTVKFVPTPGFSGDVVITYWVSDGQGGLDTAKIYVSVTGDEYVREEPRTDKLPVDPAIVTAGGGIVVKGAVVDAVREIGGFGSIAGSLGGDGVILDAANRVVSLDGLREFENGSLVVQTGALDRARLQEIGNVFAQYGRSVGLDDWNVQGATGFSLRFSIDTGELASSDGNELVFETIVREKTLIVQFTGVVREGSADVSEYRVMQANGKPLPQWLGRLGKDMVAGRWPANTDAVDLRVTAILTDGTTVTRDVRIQTNSGEIKEIEKDKLGERPRFFSDELQNQTIRPGQNTERLQQLFGR